jgi:hypothetical protein
MSDTYIPDFPMIDIVDDGYFFPPTNTEPEPQWSWGITPQGEEFTL